MDVAALLPASSSPEATRRRLAEDRMLGVLWATEAEPLRALARSLLVDGMRKRFSNEFSDDEWHVLEQLVASRHVDAIKFAVVYAVCVDPEAEREFARGSIGDGDDGNDIDDRNDNDSDGARAQWPEHRRRQFMAAVPPQVDQFSQGKLYREDADHVVDPRRLVRRFVLDLAKWYAIL
jgi:hypothetical protein